MPNATYVGQATVDGFLADVWVSQTATQTGIAYYPAGNSAVPLRLESVMNDSQEGNRVDILSNWLPVPQKPELWRLPNDCAPHPPAQ